MTSVVSVGFVGRDPTPALVVVLVVYLEHTRKLGMEVSASWTP